MRLILVRHGEKQPLSGFPETAWPLTAAAREQVRNLREQLEQLGFVLACCLTSRWQHAVDTASLLAADGDAKVVPVTGLTPHTDDRFFTLAAILEEGQQNGLSIADTQTAVLVAHHPRTSQLAKALTGTEPPELARLEALILADMPLNRGSRGAALVRATTTCSARADRRCASSAAARTPPCASASHRERGATRQFANSLFKGSRPCGCVEQILTALTNRRLT